MIRITEKSRKCSACGKCGDGWLMHSLRYENLPAVFLCASCAELLAEAAKNGRSARAEAILPVPPKETAGRAARQSCRKGEKTN